ncbi:MAG TPA: deoxyribonuclease V [Candidatus Manganitrophaceae bacterium]|nr:deoxyribonuclease V [Candidatus Manganitrophaceae bacterium]
MQYRNLHPWRVSPREAVEIQNALRPHLILDRSPDRIATVAGIDVSSDFKSNRLFAAVVVCDLENKNQKSLPVLEVAVESMEVDFPYVPGLLAFREIPVVLKAWEKLQLRPDCLICDGQGIAHPRRIGIASHLGFIVDLPSIGCCKTLLTGLYRDPGPSRGERAPLIDRQETIGAILRSKEKVAPIHISPGHRMTLDRAVEIILSCQTKYRLPEPIRLARHWVNAARKAAA